MTAKYSYVLHCIGCFFFVCLFAFVCFFGLWLAFFATETAIVFSGAKIVHKVLVNKVLNLF